jgi:hypothetical protein
MAARIAYDVKAEFDMETAAKAASKEALMAFLAGNEEHKKAKEAEKERQRQEDLDYMRQYEEILEKQQKERLARLQKLKAWQVWLRSTRSPTLVQLDSLVHRWTMLLGTPQDHSCDVLCCAHSG